MRRPECVYIYICDCGGCVSHAHKLGSRSREAIEAAAVLLVLLLVVSMAQCPQSHPSSQRGVQACPKACDHNSGSNGKE
jgi:hypothetical protein